ncbi:hypothetical protein GGI20_006129 [Coemansia sp. BCRC 34301]|nr:hypothetical protein GGI20_006129 [Coemansia sp. BCRC 34301]
MQHRIAEMTDEQFSNRVQSLIRLYQEGIKNIDTEHVIYEEQVRLEMYNFDMYAIKVGILQKVVKEELLEFWNKYINPSTAEAYTRIDVQMWSSKIWKPTASTLKAYSAKTLALFGCLTSEGNNALDIGRVDEFICTEISTASDCVGSLVEKLKSACLSESGTVYTAGENLEMSTHTNTALELAIESHSTFGDYSEVSRTNFATIGMSKTPDGIWLMEDYRKFQATQQIHGMNVPAEVLVPKYND